MEYPECEKLVKVAKKSQVIGEFIGWLRSEKEVDLYKYNPGHDFPLPFRYNIEQLLAEFFHVDLVKVEAERRALLESIRG